LHSHHWFAREDSRGTAEGQQREALWHKERLLNHPRAVGKRHDNALAPQTIFYMLTH